MFVALLAARLAAQPVARRAIGPAEDLSYQHPEIVDRLRALMGEWEKELAQSTPRFSVK